MSKKQKIRELLDRLNALDGSFLPDGEIQDLTNKIINQEMMAVSGKIRENAVIKSLEKISSEIARLKKDFKVEPIVSSIKELEKEISSEQKKIVQDFEIKLNNLKGHASKLEDKSTDQSINELSSKLTALQQEFYARLKEQEKLETDLKKGIESLKKDLEVNLTKRDLDEYSTGLERKLEKIKTDLTNRLSLNRGGAINRQINVDSSVMSTRYTDINFKNSSSIGWTAANDDTYKRVDITASILIATGGGGGSLTVKEVDGTPNVASVTTIVVSNGTLTDDGSGQVTVTTGGGGGGITRTTSVVTANTTPAAAASTDYVFFCDSGLRVFMPTAISNTNLYTMKNTGSSSVLIVASVGQAIDGSTSALMPTTNESLTLISNNSVWGVV